MIDPVLNLNFMSNFEALNKVEIYHQNNAKG